MCDRTFLLIGNNPLYSKILRHIIESGTQWSLVAEAVSMEEAVQLIEQCAPDIVLVDVDSPMRDGIEAIRYIKQHDLDMHIIAVCGYRDDEFRQASLSAGVVDYVLKEDLNRDRLLQLINRRFPK